MGVSGKSLTEQEQERIRKLREAGLSIRAVANEQSVSTRTAQKYLKQGPRSTNQGG